MSRKILLIFLISCLFPVFVAEARQAEDTLIEQAKDGDVDAMLSLGRKYYYGENTEKDYAEAFKWFTKAAREKSPVGRTWAGYLYEKGQGVEQDEAKGVSFYEKAARQDYPLAQRNLAVMYETGRGTEQDMEKAVEWYKKAAGNGDVASQKALGKIYMFRENASKKDLEEAMAWFRKAADNGDSYSRAVMGQACRQASYPYARDYAVAKSWLELSAGQGDSLGLYFLAQLYSSGEGVSEDEEKALSLEKEAVPGLKELAAVKDPYAMYALGDLYLEGEAVKKDIPSGLTLLEDAAEKGSVFAQYRLGEYYAVLDKGEKTDREPDYKKGLKWCRKAAVRSYAPAERAIGYMYFHGYGLKKNYKEAVEWTRRAAEKGDGNAQSNLGYFYANGNGVRKDLKRSIEWYKKGVESGSGLAMGNLGYAYSVGQGVQKDEKKAVELYYRAAKKGQGFAFYNLGIMYRYGNAVPENKAKAAGLYYLGAEARTKLALKNLPDLDEKTGLFVLSAIKWRDKHSLNYNRETERTVNEAVKAYDAGMIDISRNLFEEALASDARALYLDGMWYNFYEKRLPMSWTGEYLMEVPDEEKDEPAFLCDYAHCANLAGQPVLALKAVRKLEKLLAEGGVEADKEYLVKHFAAIAESNALVQMGREKEAYNTLFEAGKIEKNGENFFNYIEHWAKPLLKDKKKLSYVTGLEKEWTSKFSLPVSSDFHDIETGKIIKGTGEAPAFELEESSGASVPGTGEKTGEGIVILE
ncbi:MAG: hypothetical protein GF408_03815 [Candidatus Omnitrophica bacterium]|nr:hypothetical protein [Candidatus Omnitrophota bacterium]